ncbi:MAG TPA: hypothetical protein VF273_03550 [Pelobium sp.]
MFKKAATFENTNIYETWLFKAGHGLTIPKIGIITSRGALLIDQDLIQHEFGHILQWRIMGNWKFYLNVGVPSLWSAVKASLKKSYFHQTHAVEIAANQLAYQYFNQPTTWNFNRFPIA